MSYLNWTMLTGLVSSGIVAAVLYVKLKLAQERLASARVELAAANRSAAGLSVSLTEANRALRKAQEAARQSYEKLQESLSHTTGPAALDGLRQTIAAARNRHPIGTVLPPTEADPES